MIGGRWLPVVTAGNCNACGGKRDEESYGEPTGQVWALELVRETESGSNKSVTLFCPPCVKDLGLLALRARATDDTASMLGLTDLEYRWNQAAAGAGFAGQQPEEIFEKVQEERKK